MKGILRLWRQAVIEAVVKFLIGQPKLDDILGHVFWSALLDQDAGHEVGDGFHLCFAHAQPRHLDRAHAQAARPIPVLGLIAGNQVLVRDDVRARQLLRDVQPTAELAYIRDDLLCSCNACPI